jgi:hypothetical protein
MAIYLYAIFMPGNIFEKRTAVRPDGTSACHNVPVW